MKGEGEMKVSLLLAAFFILFNASGGNEYGCEFESCLDIYNNLKSLYEERNEIESICSYRQELKECMKKLTRKCRGDLNFHFFEGKLVKDLVNSMDPFVTKNCQGGRAVNGSSNQGSGSHHGHGKPRGNSRHPPIHDKCGPKVPVGSPAVGCALFGLTNLKSFSEVLNGSETKFCSLAGAWSLIDTHEFAVQVTNKGGLSPLPKEITTPTLVTVIIKNNECSERKTYQATFDEVPGMFSDGSRIAGNVRIETIKESEHIKIIFPYLSTVIEVFKIGNDNVPIPSLSVTIKMPQVNATGMVKEPKKLRGLPLCFYGCPKTAPMKPKAAATFASCAQEENSEEILDLIDAASGKFQVVQGSSNGGNSLVCESLANVAQLLGDINIVDTKLLLSGEENFGTPTESRISVENSALTSQSPSIFSSNFLILSFFLRYAI